MSLAVLIILGLGTPLGAMLLGAVRYVLENGPVNQVAYGMPWNLSWNTGAKSGLVFEAIRMSWVAIPTWMPGNNFGKFQRLCSEGLQNPSRHCHPLVCVVIDSLFNGAN